MNVFDYYLLRTFRFVSFCNILCLDDVRKTGKIAQLGNYSINNYFYILASWADYSGFLFCASGTNAFGDQASAPAECFRLNHWYLNLVLHEGVTAKSGLWTVGTDRKIVSDECDSLQGYSHYWRRNTNSVQTIPGIWTINLWRARVPILIVRVSFSGAQRRERR